MMKKRESILTKRILAGLMLGLLLGSSFYARPAVAGEVININTDQTGDVQPKSSLTDNIITIGVNGGGDSVPVINGNVCGAWASVKSIAANNQVIILSGTTSSVAGGAAIGSGSIINNHVFISGGRIKGDVYGGNNSGSGVTTGNRVTISDGKITGKVLGGRSYGAPITDNHIFISGGTIDGDVAGGESSVGKLENNEVVISGGTIKGNVWGGHNTGGGTTPENNSVTISGNPVFGEQTIIYGGYNLDTPGIVSNTLNIKTTGLTVKNVAYFKNYNFYLTSAAATPLLTLNGDEITKINDCMVRVFALGSAGAFQAGDSVTLLQNTNVKISDGDADYNKQMRQGVSAVYDVTTGCIEYGHKLVTVINGGKVLEQTKSPVETQAATAAFLNSGADLLAGSGIASMTAAMSAEDGAIFGAMGGGSMRYKTGSYADVKGYNLAMGFGKAVTNNAGKLTFGPFIEYGKGEYTSHLDGGIRGDGNTKYYGVGILARQDNNDGVYYEGSLRYGRRDADYASGDLINFADNRVQTSYDSSSAYYGAHLGIGKVNKLNDTTKADVYAKFMYTHQNGDSVALRGEGAGEVYDFDAVDSTRVRVGARVSKAYNNRGTGYAGLAYEYEFDGEAKATVLGFSTPSPSIKGSSGLLELGYILQPKGVNDPAIDINLQGWGGKKQGFTGNVNFVWKF
ncbi:MAG: autotransporter outer membrane beta-barrel domain-containing protein [Acidaminococcaceae bacterium]|nr:autotransporter outer membrane beta-barrel domain-containing protein [Acidaminococcaceae bacterium]